MHLHATPSLAAEVPAGVAQAQLDVLARDVEARRVQLEADIDAYIARKHDELRQYETELVETLRAMGRDDDPDDDPDDGPDAASRRSSAASTDSRGERTSQSHSPSPPPLPSPPPSQPDEHKKAKKHGRVHKRERELYGLVTPVFLPLLDARESTSTSPEKKPAPAPQHAARPPPHSQDDMPADAPAKDVKKRRSSIKKKSALRLSSAPRIRKRVSLVIDDHVVLPSDTIAEPALTSPASDTTSLTASTASLDDLIDPRLTADGPVFIEHTDAVHHSLPLSTPQPAKAAVTEGNSSPPTSSHVTSPQPTSPHVTSPHATTSHVTSPHATTSHLTSPPLPYAPPSYATRSFLDPPPEAMHIEDLPSLPTAPGPGPIYPSTDDAEDELASQAVAHDDQGFQTYVGGISGSGVDDVNQAGSVGYPSSLGASYLESYMQGRPLSVRMAAAEREGDTAELRKLRALEERRRKRESEEKKQNADDEDWDVPLAKSRDADEDDFMGSMDDF